jgi:hypothetical protein
VVRNCDEHTITLPQTAYVDKIVRCFGLEESYGVSTPLTPNVVLSKDKCPQTEAGCHAMKDIPYLAGVGSLVYASMATRPDITYATNKLSQFSTNPGPGHWTAALQVLRYLHGTCSMVLTPGGHDTMILTGFTDSDYAGCIDSCCLTSGYVFTLGSGALSWSSKFQAMVPTSTWEAEYVASCHATKEGLWLRKLVELLGFPQDTTRIWSDKIGSIVLMKDPSFHAQLKHINVQYHFVRERVAAKELTFKYLPTAEMPADMLTKGLLRALHWRFVRKMGLAGDSQWDPKSEKSASP